MPDGDAEDDHETSVCPEKHGAEGGEPLWSPAQFSLRTMLAVTTVFAMFCAVAKISGIGTAYAVGIGCLSCWMIALLVRLVRLPGRERGE